jgi:hypothetical protein
MARKQNGKRHRKDPNWKSPLSPWFASVHKASEDDWNDHPETGHVLIPCAKIGKQIQKVERGMVGKLFGLKPTSEEKFVASLPEVIPPNPNEPLGIDKASTDLEGVDDDMLKATKDELWHLNKHTQGRIIGLEPITKMVRSQFDMNGKLIVGDGEVPVFKNNSSNGQTPYLIVQSFREAVIAHQHYRQKMADKPSSIPHIVCCLPEAKIETLLPWLPPTPNVFLAHGKREGSLEQAKKIAQKLETLGVPYDFRPKIGEAKKEQEANPRPQTPAKARPRF